MGPGGEFDAHLAGEVFDLDPHELESLSRMSGDEARAFLEQIQREDETGHEFPMGEHDMEFAGEFLVEVLGMYPKMVYD